VAEAGDWQAAVKHWSDALGRVQRATSELQVQGISVRLAEQGLCMVGAQYQRGARALSGNWSWAWVLTSGRRQAITALPHYKSRSPLMTDSTCM